MLDILKKETKLLHTEVESISLASQILDHSITDGVFDEFLVRNYQSYHYIEHKLIKARHLVNQDLNSFITSDKSDSLLRDLNVIKPTQKVDQKTDLSICFAAEAVGALYVIEGSMLGASLINQHIARCPDLKKRDHHYFFSCNTQATVKRWKSFSKTIKQISFTDNEIDKAIVAAKNSFLAFKHYYTIGNMTR